jgi:hypothetical protein
MSKRHEAIGIKQVIRFEWMQKTADLLLAGLNAKAIRNELHEFLTDKKGSGLEGERCEQTRAFAVANLMNIWVSPNPELIPFRDASLALLRKNPHYAQAIYWGMVSAAYPFWFHVARQTGRLLVLQDKVTATQIINRLKEQYGDRQTTSRYARYVIRSFIAWGVLKDSPTKGCYEKTDQVIITDTKLTILMFEAALWVTQEGKSVLGLIQNNPAFFPFQLPSVAGDFISQHSERINVIRYGLGDELLVLSKLEIAER